MSAAAPTSFRIVISYECHPERSEGLALQKLEITVEAHDFSRANSRPSLNCHPERARPELCEGSASREPALSLPKGTLCLDFRATHLSKLGIPHLPYSALTQQVLRYQQPRRPMQPRPRMR